MISLLVRKAFYDSWDNLLQIMALNLLVLSIGFGFFFLAGRVAVHPALLVPILAAAFGIEGIVLVGVSSVMARVSDFRLWSARDLLSAVTHTWQRGFLFGLVALGLVALCSLTIPAYFAMGTAVGTALALVMFWFAVSCVLALQWFMPILCQLDGGFAKSLKKAFIVFLDNPGLSVFLFFCSLLLAAISVVTLGLVPGVSGVILAQNEAFHLLMRKYDWLETQDKGRIAELRKAVPWDELLAEERETVGKRSWKSFIFPWKD